MEAAYQLVEADGSHAVVKSFSRPFVYFSSDCPYELNKVRINDSTAYG
jgi:hypothetical protein